jgi:TPR repeat protein
VQDHKIAARWFLDAARQGHAEAQLNLGFMYERGDGVPQNDIQAHKWMNVAASRFGDGQNRERVLAVQARDRIAQRLSPLHLRIAQRLATEWDRRSSVAASWPPLD